MIINSETTLDGYQIYNLNYIEESQRLTVVNRKQSEINCRKEEDLRDRLDYKEYYRD